MLIDKDLRLSISGCFWLFYASKYSLCTVLENSDYLLEKRKNFFKSYLLPPHNQSATENIIHAILGTGYYTEKKQR